MVCTAASMVIRFSGQVRAPPSRAAARAATVAALVAAPIAHHERTAGGAQRRVPYLIAFVRERREAGRHLV